MDNPRFADEELFHWFKAKIMMITLHRIQAGYTRHYSQNLIQPKQHQAKRNKISALYRQLNVKGDPGLADIERRH